ncbi:MAG: alpha-glucan family phosphorylase [Acidobacteria bacterium]|nr:alpha-glucan family phosphorylase [Acidobacteriota bacterium]
MTEASTNIAQQAVTTQTEDRFRDDFEFTRDLPEALRPLDRISRNFYWSWQPDGAALFRDLSPGLWQELEQNPRLLLKKISYLRLWQRAADAAYVKRLNDFTARFERYLAEPSIEPEVAYFCAEYGIHNSLPNYSGGLGMLAGDHLKSASDLNVPLVAVGLLYRYGYFRQAIDHQGWQEERYVDVFKSELALELVLDKEGNVATVHVNIRGREVVAKAWLARVGRISLYLLDTNLPDNEPVDRLITGHLYGGDSETRIVQEKVLGIGGVRLLRKLGIYPDVYHLNEGHAAFSTLELAREHLATYADDNFAVAAERVREKCVFTTHTPVAAGNDVFDPKLITKAFSKQFFESLRLSKREFLALGRGDLSDDKEWFGMSPLAIRMCRSTNGVSAKHGEVSRKLWLKMFPDITDSDAVPITSVTNGVHAPTWIAPALQSLFREKLGQDWQLLTRNDNAWAAAVSALSDQEIWQTHRTLKNLLVAYIRERVFTKDAGSHETINEHEDTDSLLSPDALTIGFARRVAAYKRWDLLFRDIDRLLEMVDNKERPVQFIFAGKAHPQDDTAKTILQKLMSINHDSGWQRRAVFIQDYDQEVARYLVHGVDVWLNVPRRPLEASGTSGMKAGMNGALNCSILDGWWIEGFNGENGFAISGNEEPENVEAAEDLTNDQGDAADSLALYSTLENEVVPAYYSADESGLPREWIRRMRSSIATVVPRFSTDRMLRDYIARIYNIE